MRCTFTWARLPCTKYRQVVHSVLKFAGLNCCLCKLPSTWQMCLRLPHAQALSNRSGAWMVGLLLCVTTSCELWQNDSGYRSWITSNELQNLVFDEKYVRLLNTENEVVTIVNERRNLKETSLLRWLHSKSILSCYSVKWLEKKKKKHGTRLEIDQDGTLTTPSKFLQYKLFWLKNQFR